MINPNQTPEQAVRDRIDEMLSESGWVDQDNKKIDFSDSLGVAVREYQTDVGPADYVLFIDKKQAYVHYYLLYRYEDTRRVGSGNNQKALNKDRVSNLPIPLPPVDEQAAVVQELDKRLSVIEQLDRELRNRLASVSVLHQAILKKAFAGRLVAQDPGDEPASVLLEKIRTEMAKAGKNGPTARRNRKAKAAV